MHAIVHQPPNSPTPLQDVPLTWMQQPTPVPAAGEVLIQVAAAGVNQPDLLQRRGLYPPPAGHSPILGLEVAGTVVQLGADVRDIRVGDVVCALTNGGGYAEYVSVPAGQCLPIPAGLSLPQAAALPEALFTLWAHLFLRANLRGGERLLVHGAAGGVGHLAIQLAKAFGVGVLALVGTKERAAFVRKLGVERVLPEWRQQNWPAWVKETTGGDGVSVVLDHHGGSLLPQNLSVLELEGRLLIIGQMGSSGVEDGFDVNRLLTKRLTIMGATLRPRANEFKAMIAWELYQKVWPLVEQGRVKPHIHATLPMAEAAAAHQLLADNQVMGKVVLVV